jgi:hypothetical protein
VACFVAEALISGDTPTTDDSAKDIVAFWESHVTQAELAAGFMGLSAVAFVWFGASLRSALRREGDGAERLGSIAHAGTVLIAVGLFTYASLGLAVVHSVGDVPASSTQTLTVITGEDLYQVFAVGTALLVLATAIATMRYGMFPRWLGWISLVLGIVALVVVFLGVLVAGVGYIAWLLLVLWVPTVSVLIYRGQPGVA